jgi:hypothetical protein
VGCLEEEGILPNYPQWIDQIGEFPSGRLPGIYDIKMIK